MTEKNDGLFDKTGKCWIYQMNLEGIENPKYRLLKKIENMVTQQTKKEFKNYLKNIKQS